MKNKINRSSVLTALGVAAFAITSAAFACDCAKNNPTPQSVAAEKDADAPKKHPLKGVVTDILPERSAMMVKHKAIPGVMNAMTMMFTVDPSVLATVKKGDAITALMSRTADGDWRLDEVKVVPLAN